MVFPGVRESTDILGTKTRVWQIAMKASWLRKKYMGMWRQESTWIRNKRSVFLDMVVRKVRNHGKEEGVCLRLVQKPQQNKFCLWSYICPLCFCFTWFDLMERVLKKKTNKQPSYEIYTSHRATTRECKWEPRFCLLWTNKQNPSHSA